MSEGPDSRFLQANERTLLAWVRTSLGLLGLGFVIARFGAADASAHAASPHLVLVAGLAVAALAPVFLVLSLLRYLRMHKALVTGAPIPVGTRTAIALTVGAGLVTIVVLAGMLLSPAG